MSRLITNNLGFPRIGGNRELKRATEAYWNGKISKEDLNEVALEIKKKNWSIQKQKGIDLIPSNDFSFYDHVLDVCCIVGAVPNRFDWNGEKIDLELYFSMARGIHEKESKQERQLYPLEMTKWFDTNYHYLVPEFHSGQEFKFAWHKPVSEFVEALQMGIKTKPVLLGPISFLMLGKSKEKGFLNLELIERLIPIYVEVLKELQFQGAQWVQLDEPMMVTDLNEYELKAFQTAYNKISENISGLKLLLTFYFGYLESNLETAFQLPVSGYHFDLVRGRKNLDSILKQFPQKAVLSLGLVNGRGIWKNNLSDSYEIIREVISRIGKNRVMIAPSCSLMHLPLSLKKEYHLDEDIRQFLAFGEEKLEEVSTLASLFGDEPDERVLFENKKLINRRRHDPKINNPAVRERLEKFKSEESKKRSNFSVRQEKQRHLLNLPLFPTTTIGSFPQTIDIRSMRLKFKKNEITREEYDAFIRNKIKKVLCLQEELGLDVLVHGEYERSDMVEFFAEKLEGIALTHAGWVQSYGSRYVKPPIIYGDVSRPEPMTVQLANYTKSLTNRPVKAILTGPITIMQWSFNREDQPKETTTKQIALV